MINIPTCHPCWVQSMAQSVAFFGLLKLVGWLFLILILMGGVAGLTWLMCIMGVLNCLRTQDLFKLNSRCPNFHYHQMDSVIKFGKSSRGL